MPMTDSVDKIATIYMARVAAEPSPQPERSYEMSELPLDYTLRALVYNYGYDFAFVTPAGFALDQGE